MNQYNKPSFDSPNQEQVTKMTQKRLHMCSQNSPEREQNGKHGAIEPVAKQAPRTYRKLPEAAKTLVTICPEAPAN